MPSVSDSSPLIIYASSGYLDLLRQVLGEIFIPSAIWNEVVVDGGNRPEVAAVASASWIRQRDLLHPDLVQELRVELGPGESEAIGLATELDDNVPILLDDAKARRIARQRGLRVVGSAGVLLLAKQRHVISVIGPVLDDLLACGLYLSDAVAHEVLETAGEMPADTEP